MKHSCVPQSQSQPRQHADDDRKEPRIADSQVRLRLLDVRWPEIARDLERALDFDQSKIFDLVYAMNGPDNSYTSVPALNMYITSFRGNQFAVGAAIGTILLILVALIVVPYLASQFRTQEST